MAHRLVSRSGSNFVSFGAKETSATLEERDLWLHGLLQRLDL